MSPSTPLITEGSAEHSISAVDRAAARARSSGSRTSPLDELDPASSQPRQVQLRAAPVEVVEGDDLPIGVPGGEGDGEVGADEAGPAGDQQPIQGVRSYQLGIG